MYSIQIYNPKHKKWVTVMINIMNLSHAIRIKEKGAINYPDKVTRIIARHFPRGTAYWFVEGKPL